MEITWENKEVTSDQLPQIEEVSFQKHPARYLNYRFIIWGIVWTIPMSVFGVIGIINWEKWLFIPFSIISFFAILTFFGTRIGYKYRGYALRERDLTYKKGWLFFSTVTIPFNRIQHTEVSQGPIERKFKLNTLKIYTAGGSTSDLSIPGLEEDEAQRIRDYIAKKATLYA